jgi:hypothetical protein
MTKLPTSGGAWARDDKGVLKRAEAPTKANPPRARAAKGKPAPNAKPEQKDADK